MPGRPAFDGAQPRVARGVQAPGREALLAEYLGVTQDQLRRWLQARETPPQALFLKAVHVILSQWDRRDDVMAAARKH